MKRGFSDSIFPCVASSGGSQRAPLSPQLLTHDEFVVDFLLDVQLIGAFAVQIASGAYVNFVK